MHQHLQARLVLLFCDSFPNFLVQLPPLGILVVALVSLSLIASAHLVLLHLCFLFAYLAAEFSYFITTVHGLICACSPSHLFKLAVHSLFAAMC